MKPSAFEPFELDITGDDDLGPFKAEEDALKDFIGKLRKFHIKIKYKTRHYSGGMLTLVRWKIKLIYDLEERAYFRFSVLSEFKSNIGVFNEPLNKKFGRSSTYLNLLMLISAFLQGYVVIKRLAKSFKIIYQIKSTLENEEVLICLVNIISLKLKEKIRRIW